MPYLISLVPALLVGLPPGFAHLVTLSLLDVFAVVRVLLVLLSAVAIGDPDLLTLLDVSVVALLVCVGHVLVLGVTLTALLVVALAALVGLTPLLTVGLTLLPVLGVAHIAATKHQLGSRAPY